MERAGGRQVITKKKKKMQVITKKERKRCRY
jgi:hypothetical protein